MKDTLQWALIVVLAALSGYLYFNRHQAVPAEAGNPVAFDLEASHVPLVVGGQVANKCFSAGTLCFVRIRYLSTSPAPPCVPGATSDCGSGQTTRSLPDCSGSFGQLCITVSASTIAQDQDEGGVHPPLSSATASGSEARIIISPLPMPEH